ncbi:MAG: protein kinase domain-containing protein [Chlamydiota bacterium]
MSALGAGGMGEVYRARDTRLGREVAIKVLPQHLSSNPDLKARFEREARAISVLSHPHICHVYDVGTQDGTDYLVMELLDGETLADRLKKGSLPLRQALEIGVQIAEALEKAHRAGITHRDLKPGNIMLTKTGAKMLDFGLAKPASSLAAAVSSQTLVTVSKPLTAEGTLVGTFQYMAPEQLQGGETDPRTDIFALGAVLYEVVTGRRAFAGKSQVSVMSAVLEKDPDPISATQPLAPPALEHIINRALEKDPERRWQSAADLASELRWISESGSSASRSGAAVPFRRHSLRRRAGWMMAVAFALAVGIAAGIFVRPQPHLRPVRGLILPPDKTSFALTGNFAGPPVLSPDGDYVVFSAGSEGKSMLWLRPTDAAEANPLPGTEGGIFPFWSPDSHSLGFFSGGKLKVTDINGGAPLAIADALNARGGAWGANGDILYTPDTQAPVLRIGSSGGTPVPATQLDQSRHTSHRWPYFLPDGKHFLYVAINHDASKSDNDAIYYGSLDGKENRPLLHSFSNAIYASGYLLYARDTLLMARAFDPASGQFTGDPLRVTDGVANDSTTWHMDASASSNGLLVLGSGGSSDLSLVWLDRAGKQIGVIADKLPGLINARLSPGGERMALQIDAGVNDLWVLDLSRGVRTRITFGPNNNSSPVWSPDGEWIAYAGTRNGQISLYRRRADGSGGEELLLSDHRKISQCALCGDLPVDWSRDGRYLLYLAGPPGPNAAVWALPLTGDRKPFLVVAAPSPPQFGRGAQLSPDARWLAYGSAESGHPEIYVIPFRGGQGKWQISQGYGLTPEWGADGKEIYYAGSGGKIFSVSVSEERDAIRFGAPTLLFASPSTQQSLFDVTPDNKKISIDVISQQTSQPLTIIINWMAGLKK